MNTKKLVLIAVMACSVILFSSIHALAAANWFTATVVSSTAGTTFQCQLTGTEDGGSRSFTGKTFLLYQPLQNQMLAVLLTAQSMGSSVRVYVDPDAGIFPTLYGIGLRNQ
jgi:hypothetical protein